MHIINIIFSYRAQRQQARIKVQLWERSVERWIVCFETLPQGDRPDQNPGPSPTSEISELLTQFVNSYGLDPNLCAFLLSDGDHTSAIVDHDWRREKSLTQILESSREPGERWKIKWAVPLALGNSSREIKVSPPQPVDWEASGWLV